ncbi:MAG: flagellar biosynthetic protein FliO [Planctomycetota bacterium]
MDRRFFSSPFPKKVDFVSRFYYNWLGMTRRLCFTFSLVALCFMQAGLSAGEGGKSVSFVDQPRAGLEDAKKGKVAPPPNPTLAKFEASPLGEDDVRERRLPDSVQPGSPWVALLQLIGALCVLCGLAWGGLALIKRFLPGGRRFFASAGAEILGRTYLDSRRYIALVRVGSRILVVGVSPEGIALLSEVHDAEEVADLLRSARPKTEAGRSVFQSLLQGRIIQQKEEAGHEEALAATGGEMARLKREMENIQARIHGLRSSV